MMKLSFLLLLLALAVALSAEEESSSKQTYIIHMDKSLKPTAFIDHSSWYDSCLRSVSASSTASTLYTYTTAVHGFSSRLTAKEARSLEELPGILAVMPETVYRLHTTRTPEFLRLIRRADAGEEGGFMAPQASTDQVVVVGVLDTGVWPELKSFDDAGLGPVPRSWRGSCEEGTRFNSTSCNGKVIGARFFSRGYEAFYGPIDESVESKSPRDDDGHGSHTSTTAAGSVVPDASLFGFASGSARGMAPQARLAIYKVCWKGGCFGSDILAAMDRAVQDGVNILSMSIGGGVSDYHSDLIAIAAFGATARGVFVSCSAGNEGPALGTVSNVAPWITTVGAGTLDRDFPTYVTLGNGKRYVGVSLYDGRPLSRNASIDSVLGGLCLPRSLTAVRGKIVICDRGENLRAEKGMVVKEAGGVGMILVNTKDFGEELVADAHLLPSVALGFKAGEEIKKYVVSDPNPIATVVPGGTRLGVEPSPVVAAFSSRGPNLLTSQILKPDLIAPGVNILAGWTGSAGPTGLDGDKRRVGFNIVSGTSMSCPHVSGLAALLKGAHPDWSPAAIRSALMTTTYSTYTNGETIRDLATGDPSTPFHYGSGHVDPVSAADPGLVYDVSEEDYLGFLCALNYTSSQIKTVAKIDFACDPNKTYSVSDLNYPSFAVPFETASTTNEGRVGPGRVGALSTVTYARTLTNVGGVGTYAVSVSSGTQSVRMSVEPGVLRFGKLYEKKSYVVTFVANSMPSGTTSFGSLEWSDGKHKVRSPIAFSWT